jgi:hypothetical protein
MQLALSTRRTRQSPLLFPTDSGKDLTRTGAHLRTGSIARTAPCQSSTRTRFPPRSPPLASEAAPQRYALPPPHAARLSMCPVSMETSRRRPRARETHGACFAATPTRPQRRDQHHSPCSTCPCPCTFSRRSLAQMGVWRLPFGAERKYGVSARLKCPKEEKLTAKKVGTSSGVWRNVRRMLRIRKEDQQRPQTQRTKKWHPTSRLGLTGTPRQGSPARVLHSCNLRHLSAPCSSSRIAFSSSS